MFTKKPISLTKQLAARSVFLSLICLNALPVSAAENSISSLPIPDASPARSISKRARMVDGQLGKPWKGKSRMSVLTFNLGRTANVSKLRLFFKRSYHGINVRVLVRDILGGMDEVLTMNAPSTDRNLQLELAGILRSTDTVQVILEGRSGRRWRRRGTPRINEVEIYEQTATSPTPTPTPSPTPTPTPKPKPNNPLKVDMVEAVSVNSLGEQSPVDSREPNVSEDGNYVLFKTRAKGFYPGSNYNNETLFLRDRQNGTTEPVAKETSGKFAFTISHALSADGSMVAFSSISNKIVAGDSNGNTVSDIIIYDVQGNQYALASVDSQGQQSNGSCMDPYLSRTGRYVVFACFDTNLDPNDNNGFQDIYWHDLLSGDTQLISVNSNGDIGDSNSYEPSVSDDGRYVVWQSNATNFDPVDNNNDHDVFIRDLQTGVTELVSKNSQNQVGNFESDYAKISGDGSTVVFQTFATNLVSGITLARSIVAWDKTTKQMTLISENLNGIEANGDSFFPTVSSDGRYVGFESAGSDLVQGDNNNARDAFIVDRQKDQILLVSQTPQGVLGNGDSQNVHISGDGMTLIYETQADNLFPLDQNFFQDIVASDLTR